MVRLPPREDTPTTAPLSAKAGPPLSPAQIAVVIGRRLQRFIDNENLANRIAFLDAQPSAVEMLADIRNFIDKWLPAFKNDNRSYLTVAIGCTGGQHRSVYMAERLGQHFAGRETVIVRHREQ